MKYIECHEEYSGKEKSLFLAGGITNCENWQIKLVELLKDQNLVLLNPRRKFFDVNNKSIELEQINWEHKNMNKANFISFWFSPETLCPITLFELGKFASTKKRLFVGVHPKYKRKRDVEIQLSLMQPEIKIVYSIEDLAKQIILNISEKKK